MNAENGKLHIVTPLLHSPAMSDLVAMPVFMKCDNCQPTGSFKLRGMGHLMQKLYNEGIREVVIASGGNAGLAVAYSARHLGMDALVLCNNYISRRISQEIERLGGRLQKYGSIWDETNQEAKRIAADQGRTYITPFDDPVIWEGHKTVVDEIKDQLDGTKPRCIVVSVGGGGYMAGVLEGVKKHNWVDVPIVAVETVGTACLNESIKCRKHIVLDKVTGIAECLKCKQVAKRVYDAAINEEQPIISVTVSDEEALQACYQFLDDHRFMVEPACGAALTIVYSNIIGNLVDEGRLPNVGPVVVLICGGSGVTQAMLQNWKDELALST